MNVGSGVGNCTSQCLKVAGCRPTRSIPGVDPKASCAALRGTEGTGVAWDMVQHGFPRPVTREGLLRLREIEKDLPALMEVLKRFLDFGNRIDRGHRHGQRAGGDEGSCLDLRGEHFGDMVVVA